MRASKWTFPDAQKRIKSTLEWRREFKPELIPPDEVRIESETGKMYVRPFYILSKSDLTYFPIATRSILNGFDRDGRPILYMRPGRENTETGPRQLRHLVWCLFVCLLSPLLLWLIECCVDRERAKDLMPPDQESLVIIVDYKSTTLRTNPSISVARKVGFGRILGWWRNFNINYNRSWISSNNTIAKRSVEHSSSTFLCSSASSTKGFHRFWIQ